MHTEFASNVSDPEARPVLRFDADSIAIVYTDGSNLIASKVHSSLLLGFSRRRMDPPWLNNH